MNMPSHSPRTIPSFFAVSKDKLLVFFLFFLFFMESNFRNIIIFIMLTMLIASCIKYILFEKPENKIYVDTSILALVPNPLVPWEIFPDADPDIFRCSQGLESSWLEEIWFPYWENLSEEEKIKVKQNAPTDDWRDWIERYSEIAYEAKKFREKKGIPFDYHIYLEDFKIHYAIYYLQVKTTEDKH